MLHTPAEQLFLKSISTFALVEYVRGESTPFPGLTVASAMAWLKQNRKNDYFVVLACMYDVAVYEVDGVTAGTQGCRPDEIGKFTASTITGDFEDAPEIPLQNSMDESFRVACELLGLEQLFQRECEAGGVALARVCNGASVSISGLIPHIIAEVRAHETMSVSELNMVVSAETGEFSEAILVERGLLPSKHLKEPAMGEAADVFIATLCVLAKQYPDLSPEQLGQEVAKWVNIKMHKYSDILHADPAALTSVRTYDDLAKTM